MNHPSKIVIFFIGLLAGTALEDYIYYFRLKDPILLREMILYLESGDLNIFFGFGTLGLFGTIFSVILIYAINNYAFAKKSVTEEKA